MQATSYLVTTGDYMKGALEFFFEDDSDSVLLNRNLWIGLSFVIIGPLAFLRTLDSLRFTSAVALVAVAYLFALIVAQYGLAVAGNTQAPPEDLCLFNLDVGFFKVMTIFVFGFTCHQNVRPAARAAVGGCVACVSSRFRAHAPR